MDTKVIVANAIGFISFIIFLIAFQKEDKKKMFKTTLIANILNLIQYVILNADSGVATKIIAVCRDLAISKQDKYSFLKSKKLLNIFVIVYILLMYFTFDGFLSIFSLTAALIYTAFCWNGDINTVRRVRIITNLLWLLYNVYVKAYTSAMTNCIFILSTILAINNSRKINSVSVEKGLNENGA